MIYGVRAYFLFLSFFFINHVISDDYRSYDNRLLKKILESFQKPDLAKSFSHNHLSFIEFEVMYQNMGRDRMAISFIDRFSKPGVKQDFYQNIEEVLYGDNKILSLYCSAHKVLKDSYLVLLPSN